MKDLSNKTIWIFGGANIDICGASTNALVDYDSNIGEIEISFGGVGRNIAQSLSLLSYKDDDDGLNRLKDYNVRLVTCFSHDYFGQVLMEDCKTLDIDITYSKVSDTHSSSIYLALLDENRDMRIAMSDMRILDELTESDIMRALRDVKEEDIVLLDSNFEKEKLDLIIDNTSCRLASDPVSINKINRLETILPRLSIFKPNRIEAESLNHIEIKDKESATASLKWFLETGIEEIIITMAHEGVLLGFNDNGYHLYWLKHRATNMHSANGGGDAFFGAYLSRRIKNYSPMDSSIFAICTAVKTIESSLDSKRLISSKVDEDSIKDMNITIEPLY